MPLINAMFLGKKARLGHIEDFKRRAPGQSWITAPAFLSLQDYSRYETFRQLAVSVSADCVISSKFTRVAFLQYHLL